MRDDGEGVNGDSIRTLERVGLGLSPSWLLEQKTGWLINNGNFISVLEATSPRPGCQQGRMGAPFQVSDFAL